MIVHNNAGNACISDTVKEIELTVWQTAYDRQPVVVIGDLAMMLDQWIEVTTKMGVMLHELKTIKEKEQ